MIFWNIKLLKQRLIDEGLSQKYLFIYIFINIMLYEFVIAGNYLLPSDYDLNIYDYAGSITDFSIACLATYLIYRVNGGPEGKQFAERFFSIGFVVGLRFCVLFVPVLIALVFGLEEADDGSISTTWYETSILSFWLVVFYWRIIVHVKEVANNSIV